MVLTLSIVLEKIKKRNKIYNTSMVTLNYSNHFNYSNHYFPEDPNNMSYEETAYFIYGVDIDEKEEDNEKK